MAGVISARYAVAVCVVAALALVPTIIHTYAGFVVTDGRHSTTIPETLAGFTSAPSTRDARWGKRQFESDDWFERTYRLDQDEVLLTVLRSYDLKRLYHHPELAVAYGAAYLHHDVLPLSGLPDVPVHVLRTDSAGGDTAMYVLHYGDGFVREPLWFQVRVATELLFGGRRPMTLIFVRDVRGQGTSQLEMAPSARVLVAAVEQFVGATPRSR
jgi:hypothetical protein